MIHSIIPVSVAALRIAAGPLPSEVIVGPSLIPPSEIQRFVQVQTTEPLSLEQLQNEEARFGYCLNELGQHLNDPRMQALMRGQALERVTQTLESRQTNAPSLSLLSIVPTVNEQTHRTGILCTFDTKPNQEYPFQAFDLNEIPSESLEALCVQGLAQRGQSDALAFLGAGINQEQRRTTCFFANKEDVLNLSVPGGLTTNQSAP